MTEELGRALDREQFPDDEKSLHIIKPPNVELPFDEETLRVLRLGLKWIPRRPEDIHQSIEIAFDDHVVRSRMQYSNEQDEAALWHSLAKPYHGMMKAYLFCRAKVRKTEDLQPDDDDDPKNYPGLEAGLAELKNKLKSDLPSRFRCSKEEQRTLEILRQIKAKEGWIVKAADKNQGLCIIHKSYYDAMMTEIISDQETYLPITPVEAKRKIVDHCRTAPDILTVMQRTPLDPESSKTLTRIFKRLLRIEEIGELATTPVEDLEPKLRSVTSTLYAMPKVHKKDAARQFPPARPLVQGFSTLTADVNRWLARLLFPWTAFCETSILEVDQARETIQQLVLNDDVAIVSSDISAMYPAIRVEDSIDGLQGLFRLIVKSVEEDDVEMEDTDVIENQPAAIDPIAPIDPNQQAAAAEAIDPNQQVAPIDPEQQMPDGQHPSDADHVLLNLSAAPTGFHHLPIARSDGTRKPTRREILQFSGWILESDWHRVLTMLFKYSLGGVVIKMATRSGFSYYSQEVGLAMGYSLSPIAAILAVWYRCELPSLGQIYANTYLYGRYIDDILLVAPSDNPIVASQESIDHWLASIYSENMPSLRLTTTDPQLRTGTTFLDMEIYASPDGKALLTRSHIKKESAHQYIMESSNHPPTTFRAVVQQSVSRELNLNSEMTWLNRRLRELCTRFAKRGYSVDKLNFWINEQVLRKISDWKANKRFLRRQQDNATQKGIPHTSISESDDGQMVVRTLRRWNPFVISQGFNHPIQFIMQKTRNQENSVVVPFRMPYISIVQAQRLGHQLHSTYAAVGVSVEDATPVVAWILRDNLQKLTVSAKETGGPRPLEADGSIPLNRRRRTEEQNLPHAENEDDNDDDQDNLLNRAYAKRVRQDNDTVDAPMCST